MKTYEERVSQIISSIVEQEDDISLTSNQIFAGLIQYIKDYSEEKGANKNE